MEYQMISHPRLSVRKVTGAEGPRHDPYAYTEWHVSTDQHKVVLHTGLGMWIKVDGEKWPRPAGMDSDLWEKVMYDTLFPQHVGFTVAQIERIYTRLSSRCKACGGKEFECVAGYPGESFEMCVACKHINGSTFDRSAIE